MCTPASGCCYGSEENSYNHFITPNSALAETLDTIVNNVAASKKTPAHYRKKLYKLRREIGKHISRVRPCGKYLRHDANAIDISKGVTTGRHYYSGLQSCHSVWSCPVCSLKITQERAKQIRDIALNAQRVGLHLTFATFTIPHTAFQTCKELKTAVADGFRKMTATRSYRSLKEKYNIVGYIRSLEITRGDNGWHPHLHVLYFFEDQPDKETALEATNLMFHDWSKTIKRMGYGDCSEDAFAAKSVYDGEDISDYISKWDMSKELAEGHTKKSSNTPFMLFDDYLNTGNEKSLNLFKEFSIAFHGARHITFSRGLKERFSTIEDLTDEEACQNERGTIVLTISKDVWKIICGAKVEADILNVLDEQGIDSVHYLLTDLGCYRHGNIYLMENVLDSC